MAHSEGIENDAYCSMCRFFLLPGVPGGVRMRDLRRCPGSTARVGESPRGDGKPGRVARRPLRPRCALQEARCSGLDRGSRSALHDGEGLPSHALAREVERPRHSHDRTPRRTDFGPPRFLVPPAYAYRSSFYPSAVAPNRQVRTNAHSASTRLIFSRPAVPIRTSQNS